MFFIYLLVLINIFIILLHESSDLFIFETISDFVEKSKLRNSVYIDVYSESNDVDTGKDNRLAIVHPFNWYAINSRSDIYVYSTLEDFGKMCDGHNLHGFVKLKNPLSGQSLQNAYKVCLPVTISSMVTHFSDKPKTRIFFEPEKNRIGIMDIVNHLLVTGAFTNFMNE